VSERVEGRPIMAVVKCNAYGHGAVEIAKALQRDSQINHFMVVKPHEAFDLRQAGINGLILNVGPFSKHDLPNIFDLNISQSVYTNAVDILNETAKEREQKAKVHLCIDTGMGREGISYKDALPFMRRVAGLSHIEIEGTFTVMTEVDGFNQVQIERLNTVCAEAEAEGIQLGIKHAASTAEVISYPGSWLDMVRPGNCLVGLQPEHMKNMTIKPVMTFKTRVMNLRDFDKGDTLSYGRRYKIERPTRIALLPCGYTEGYQPALSGKADVLIRGRRFPIVAPITANHMMIDVTGADDIAIGDEVVLWGKQGDQHITKGELSKLAGGGLHAYRLATGVRTYLVRQT